MEGVIDLIMRTTGWTKDQQALILRAGWVGLVSIHILWVCGWLSAFGVEAPFAYSSYTASALAEMRQDRVERIDHNILTVRSSQCHATTPEARSQYGERLAELVATYIRLSGKEPRIPKCDEV